MKFDHKGMQDINSKVVGVGVGVGVVFGSIYNKSDIFIGVTIVIV